MGRTQQARETKLQEMLQVVAKEPCNKNDLARLAYMLMASSCGLFNGRTLEECLRKLEMFSTDKKSFFALYGFKPAQLLRIREKGMRESDIKHLSLPSNIEKYILSEDPLTDNWIDILYRRGGQFVQPNQTLGIHISR